MFLFVTLIIRSITAYYLRYMSISVCPVVASFSLLLIVANIYLKPGNLRFFELSFMIVEKVLFISPSMIAFIIIFISSFLSDNIILLNFSNWLWCFWTSPCLSRLSYVRRITLSISSLMVFFYLNAINEIFCLILKILNLIATLCIISLFIKFYSAGLPFTFKYCWAEFLVPSIELIE